MPDRYWVGGTASWDGTAGTKWSATSGGPGGASVPTTADAVFFTNLSTGTCTIATGNTGAASINCTGFAGTITGTAAITVAGSVTLAAAMTYTHTGTMTFTGTGTLTTAGKIFSAVTVNGAGITLTLGDALNNATRTLTVTAGTFTTAGFSITGGTLSSSNSNTRTINLGSSTVTLGSVGTALSFATSTNLTFNAGTSQINLSSLTPTLSGGGQTFNNVSFTGTTGSTATANINGTNTFNNLTIAAPAGASYTRLSFSNNQTITGTLTCAGASAIRRVFISGSTLGTAVVLTAGALSANDCDFRDIDINGGAVGTAPTRAGDCGGNSDIVFPAAKTVYRVGTNTTWFGSSSWAPNSNGTGNDNNFPLPQDTAVIDNSTGSGFTLQMPVANVSSLDASSRTTALTLSFSNSGTYYGSVAFGSGITVSGTDTQTFSGRGTMDFTSAGKTITFSIIVDAPGGTFRLLGATTLTTSCTLSRGTLNLNDLTLTCTSFTNTSGFTRTLAFGVGNVTVTGVGTVYSGIVSAGLTVTGTPVVNVTNATASATTVTPGSATESNTISFNFTAGTYALTLNPGNVRNLNFTGFAGTLTNTDRSIFGDLTISAGMALNPGAGAQTFASTSGTPRTIRTNGVAINFPLVFNGVGGAWRLDDALTMVGARSITHSNGTLDLNGFTLSNQNAYSVPASGTQNLTFNGGTLLLSAGGTAFSNLSSGGYTTTAGTGIGTINLTSGSAKTFAGAGRVYNCTLNNGGAGALTITGSNTFTTLQNSVQPTSFLFTAGTTTTLSNWEIDGTPGNLVTIGSVTAASHTLSKVTGTVSADYLSISRSTATGGATWYAGANSTDGGNNSGWIFTAPPGPPAPGNGNFFFLIGGG
jgi:fibronectin-binding autotransporter adhesin